MTGSLQIKNGYYYAVLNFYTVQGKRKLTWIKTGYAVSKNTKRKAKEKLNQLIALYSGREIVDESKNLTVPELAWKWLESVEPTIVESTYDSYYSNILHIEQFFGSGPYKGLCVDQLTCSIIEEFYLFLLKEGRLVHRKGDKSTGLSRKFVLEVAKNLNRILDYASKRKVQFVNLDENPNPAKLVRVPKKPEPCKEYAYLDEKGDTEVFLNAIKGHILEPYFIITLFYGLRRSEALGLKWSAVNLNKRTLVIKHTVVKNRRLIEKDLTKNTESHREYPITEFIYQILTQLQQKQREYKRLLGADYYESDYVFTWNNGKPFSPDYPTKTFKKIVTKTEGLDNRLRLHDLRASCVTMLAQQGYNLKEIQKWVGHAENSDVTMKAYMRVKDTTKVDIGKSLNGSFNTFSAEMGQTKVIVLPQRNAC